VRNSSEVAQNGSSPKKEKKRKKKKKNFFLVNSRYIVYESRAMKKIEG
jgi:hypothetical protein